MKYRVLKRNGMYYPQYKNSWWTGWRYFTTIEFFGDTTVYYGSAIEAINYCMGLTAIRTRSSKESSVIWEDSIHNLEYSTQKENLSDRDKHGTKIEGSRSPNAKLTELEVINILSIMSEYSLTALATMFNVHRATIYDIKVNKSWKHVSSKIIKELTNGNT